MRPCVIGIHVEILAATPPHVQQHAVVALGPAIIPGSDITEIGRRIGEIQDPALVDIGCSRTDGIGHGPRRGVEGAGTHAQPLGRIEFQLSPQMSDMRSDVRSRYKQVWGHLPLDTEIP